MSLLPLEVTILFYSSLARDTAFLSSSRRVLGLMMGSSYPWSGSVLCALIRLEIWRKRTLTLGRDQCFVYHPPFDNVGQVPRPQGWGSGQWQWKFGWAHAGRYLGAAKRGLPLYFPLSSENTESPIILNACRS